MPPSLPRVVNFRSRHGTFGFDLVGDAPVRISTVKAKGAAAMAGLRPNDQIVGINGKRVARWSHARVVELVKNSAGRLRLVVINIGGDGGAANNDDFRRNKQQQLQHRNAVVDRFHSAMAAVSQSLAKVEASKIPRASPAKQQAFRRNIHAASSSNLSLVTYAASPRPKRSGGASKIPIKSPHPTARQNRLVKKIDYGSTKPRFGSISQLAASTADKKRSLRNNSSRSSVKNTPTQSESPTKRTSTGGDSPSKRRSMDLSNSASKQKSAILDNVSSKSAGPTKRTSTGNASPTKRRSMDLNGSVSKRNSANLSRRTSTADAALVVTPSKGPSSDKEPSGNTAAAAAMLPEKSPKRRNSGKDANSPNTLLAKTKRRSSDIDSLLNESISMVPKMESNVPPSDGLGKDVDQISLLLAATAEDMKLEDFQSDANTKTSPVSDTTSSQQNIQCDLETGWKHARAAISNADYFHGSGTCDVSIDAISQSSVGRFDGKFSYLVIIDLLKVDESLLSKLDARFSTLYNLKSSVHVGAFLGVSQDEDSTLIGAFQLPEKACSLSDTVQKRNLSSIALKTCHAIATGLAVLHNNNIVHGNLSADSVFIDEDDSIVLCDYGLSLTQGNVAEDIKALGAIVESLCADVDGIDMIRSIWANADKENYPSLESILVKLTLILDDEDSSDSDLDSSDDSDDCDDSEDDFTVPKSVPLATPTEDASVVLDSETGEWGYTTTFSDMGTTPLESAALKTAIIGEQVAVEAEDDDLDFFALLSQHQEKAETSDWSLAVELEDVVKDQSSVDGPELWRAHFAHLLQSKEGKDLFRRFLKTIFCEENMLFWNNVEHLRSLSQGEVEEECQKIYKLHCQPGAPKAINVKARTLMAVKDALAAKSCSIQLFSAAQREVYDLMKSDSYPRFLASKLFHDRVCGGSSKEVDLEDVPATSSPASSSYINSSHGKKKNNSHSNTKRKLFGLWGRNKDKGKRSQSSTPNRDDNSVEIPENSAMVLFGVNMVLGKEKHRTVVQAPPNQSISDALTRVLERFKLNREELDIFKDDGQSKILWSDTVVSMHSKEIRLDPKKKILLAHFNAGEDSSKI